MNSSFRTVLAIVLVAGGLVGVTGWYFLSQSSDESTLLVSVFSGRASSSGESRRTAVSNSAPKKFVHRFIEAKPRSIGEQFEKLAEQRPLITVNASLADCLHDLSLAMQTNIRIDDSLSVGLWANQTASFKIDEPVSFQTAIQIIATQWGLMPIGIHVKEDELVVVPDTDSRPALRTIDLSGTADFTTQKRARILEEIVTQVAPDSWKDSETWVRAGASVFEIDVYHTGRVFREVVTRFQPRVSFRQLLGTGPFPPAAYTTVVGPSRSDPSRPKTPSDVVKLRERFAFESISDRLAYEQREAKSMEIKLSPSARQRLADRDELFSNLQTEQFNVANHRLRSLQALHEEEVNAFINRPGFGVGRMPAPGAYYLEPINSPSMALASIEYDASNDASLETIKRQSIESQAIFLPSQQIVSGFHFQNDSLFAPLSNDGYIKSRDQVAGFEPHAFQFTGRIQTLRGKPWYFKPQEQWAMRRVELISLLKHESPRVYLSESLPRMDELDDTKTRDLNDFEQKSLDKLLQGRDVEIEMTLNRIRMVGSLRATKQCQQCHEVAHGEILGAFSYEMLRDPQIDAKAISAATSDAN